MMKPSKALGVAAIVSIAVVFLFLTSAAAPAMSSSQANAFTSSQQQNLLPNPVLNSNITWSTHYAKWGVLEYNNSKQNLTLSAHLNSQYANPISINPSDIVSNQLTGKSWAGQNWEDTGNWTVGTSYGGTGTITAPTTGGIEITVNGSKAGAVGDAIVGQSALESELPNSNPQYLYETITGYSTTSTTMTGTTIAFYIPSTINYGIAVNGTQIVNQSKEGSLGNPLIPTNEPFMISFPLSDFMKTLTNYQKPTIRAAISIPTQTVSDNYVYLHITGASITTHIMSLGTNNNKQVEGSFGNVELNTLDPTFQYSSITNGGYSVAVTQSIENLTTQQSEISGNPSYVEQVTYEGNYCLPPAPDLTYSTAVISEKFNVSPTQTTVLDVNGLSLLNTISGKNGTITLMTVNPNQKTTLIQIVDYTSSQWESVSGPPGFFSVNGILYYFDEIVLGIIAVVGLAGGAAVARTRSLRRVK